MIISKHIFVFAVETTKYRSLRLNPLLKSTYPGLSTSTKLITSSYARRLHFTLTLKRMPAENLWTQSRRTKTQVLLLIKLTRASRGIPNSRRWLKTWVSQAWATQKAPERASNILRRSKWNRIGTSTRSSETLPRRSQVPALECTKTPS